jgi:hypothetical protein
METFYAVVAGLGIIFGIGCLASIFIFHGDWVSGKKSAEESERDLTPDWLRKSMRDRQIQRNDQRAIDRAILRARNK